MESHDAEFAPRIVPKPAPAVEPIRVSFGPKDHQWITPELASMVLTDWREQSPAQFGKYLARAMTGVNPAGGQGSK